MRILIWIKWWVGTLMDGAWKEEDSMTRGS